jgi:UDP-N-acetylglucosamine:LPS N-acetylglucosamine transferase
VQAQPRSAISTRQMTGEQLKKAVAEFEAEWNQKKAYRAALAKVKRMRKAGKSVAEILKWARAA